MGFRVVLCAIASFLLVCTFIAAGLGSKKAAQESALVRLIDLMETNQEMAELILANCRLELVQNNIAVEELDFHVPGENSSVGTEMIVNRSLIRLDTQKIIRTLDSKVGKTLLGCLREKDLMFLLSSDERDSKSWYIRHLELIYTWADASSRRKLVQTTGEEPAPAPTLSPAPSPMSSSAPTRSRPATQSMPDLSAPALSFFPRDISDSNSAPPPSEQTSPKISNKGVKADKQNSSQNTVVIAVTVTAASTLVVLAVLFLCCRKFCGAGAAQYNDESPLLSLSSSHSTASSHKSFAVSHSIVNEKHSRQSFHKSASHLVDSHSNIEISIGNVAGGENTSVENPILQMAGLPPLKPPPGRVASQVSSIEAHLKPPPGRVASQVSSFEAHLKPPPGRVASQVASFGPRVGPGNAVPPSTQPPSAPSAPPPPPPPMLKPSGGPRPPGPGPPPPPPPVKNGPRPPPPPGGGAGPRPPPLGFKPPRPLGSNNQATSANFDGDANASKAKLKPFFWDKVMANPDNSMVWHQIKSGSFQFNEEMIETLFGYTPPEKTNSKSKDPTSQDPAKQYIQIIDAKKSQNLSILLKALNVTTEEVCDALQEGNELPAEFIQTLLKMAPTTDEELKLRLYSGDLSRLGTAERFLKVLVDVPFAFKRLESLHFMCTLEEEASSVAESLKTLEAACTELRKSRLFLKLLEAVLKTGNRMNSGTFRGGAQAFKLDTLLKLSDVKGLDGKTTLLHFVVQEIIRTEGIRAARAAREMRSMSSFKSDDLIEDVSQDTEEMYRSMGLQVVSRLGSELEHVKKAAILDADSLTGTVAKLGHGLIKARDFLNVEMKDVDEDKGFHQALEGFVQNAEADIMSLLEEEKKIMALIKSTGDYFHGNAGKDEGLRLFVIVRDFLVMLDKVCIEVKNAAKNLNKPRKKEDTEKREDNTKKEEDAKRKEDSRGDAANTVKKEDTERKEDSRGDTANAAKKEDTERKDDTTSKEEDKGVAASDSEPLQNSTSDPRQRLIPAIAIRRIDSSSSSDEDEP